MSPDVILMIGVLALVQSIVSLVTALVVLMAAINFSKRSVM